MKNIMCVVGWGYWRHLQIPDPLLKSDALGGEGDLGISVFNTFISGDVGEVAGTTLCELMLCGILSILIDLLPI